VLLISSGIDPLYFAPDLDDPYLDACVRDAQRAGIALDSIYYGSAGHLGHSFWRVNWGQNYLSEMGDRTGGEMYWQGMLNPVSFAPFLEELSQRLNNQYLLTVSLPAPKKAELQSVRVRSTNPGVSLMSASEISVGH
jgi:hypothetical protein